MQLLPHRLRTGLKEEHAPEPLRDAFDAEGRVVLLQLNNPVCHRLGQSLLPGSRVRRRPLQPLLPEGLITLGPISDRVNTQVEFLGDGRLTETLFEIKLHRAKLELEGIALAGRFFGPAREPPRGLMGVLLLYWSYFIIHGCTHF